MSKPKAGLGKGLVRNFAHSHHPIAGPSRGVVSGAAYTQTSIPSSSSPWSLVVATSGSGGTSSGNAGNFASLGLPLPQPAYVPLLPVWDFPTAAAIASASAATVATLQDRASKNVLAVDSSQTLRSDLYSGPSRLAQSDLFNRFVEAFRDLFQQSPASAWSPFTQHTDRALQVEDSPKGEMPKRAVLPSSYIEDASDNPFARAGQRSKRRKQHQNERQLAIARANGYLFDSTKPAGALASQNVADVDGLRAGLSSGAAITSDTASSLEYRLYFPGAQRRLRLDFFDKDKDNPVHYWNGGHRSPSPGPSGSPTLRSQAAEESLVMVSLADPDEIMTGPAPSGQPSTSYAIYNSVSLRSQGSNEPIPIPPSMVKAPLSRTYASNLVFDIGASGLPKERVSARPPSSSRSPPPPLPPPRERNFPLPQVESPKEIHSIGVGEDAYFARADSMCVADGVGGWAKSGRGGADAGRWSRLLVHYVNEERQAWWDGADEYVEKVDEVQRRNEAEQKMRKEAALKDEGIGASWAGRLFNAATGSGEPTHTGGHNSLPPAARQEDDDSAGLEDGWKRRRLDPVEIMQKGFEKCLACVLSEGLHGSSTCLLALLHHSTLLIANLGDCCLLLIRDGVVVFRTSEMQHAFNFPLQLGTHSRDEPMKDAKGFEVPILKEDIVVLGSDGLMDNLFDEDIVDVLAEFAQPTNPETDSAGGLPPFNPQQVSEALCKRARMVSEQTTATTPFMVRAIDEGIDFVGGKKDDISVIVGVIGERTPVDRKQGLASHA